MSHIGLNAGACGAYFSGSSGHGACKPEATAFGHSRLCRVYLTVSTRKFLKYNFISQKNTEYVYEGRPPVKKPLRKGEV